MKMNGNGHGVRWITIGVNTDFHDIGRGELYDFYHHNSSPRDSSAKMRSYSVQISTRK